MVFKQKKTLEKMRKGQNDERYGSILEYFGGMNERDWNRNSNERQWWYTKCVTQNRKRKRICVPDDDFTIHTLFWINVKSSSKCVLSPSVDQGQQWLRSHSIFFIFMYINDKWFDYSDAIKDHIAKCGKLKCICWWNCSGH